MTVFAQMAARSGLRGRVESSGCPAGEMAEGVGPRAPRWGLLLLPILALAAAGSILIAIHHGGLDDALTAEPV